MAAHSGGTDYGPWDQGSRFRLLNMSSPAIKKPKRDINSRIIDNRTGFEVAEFPEFYIMTRIEDNLDLSKVNPFYIEKALNIQVGLGTNTKRLRDGSLLIQCKTESQA